jgi:DNA-nicking Smr family endonuclease
MTTVTDDEKAFRDAMRDVAPHDARAPVPVPPKPVARARFTRLEAQQVLRESLLPVTDPALLETGDELSFRRDSVSPQILKRLRRGEFSVHAEIDLHGLTAIEARAVLSDFIHETLQHNHTCVRIVHGKGKRSGPKGPVLKNVVNVWLQQCDAVRAFGSARPVDGGSGAVLVLLSQGR